jgi:uncharacterized protein (TIGR03435 family)
VSEWANTQVVSVDATLPPHTTQEEFREMLRTLIVERFQLQYHIDTKETGRYSLVVAKGGPKLKTAAPPKDDVAPDANRIRGTDAVQRYASHDPDLADVAPSWENLFVLQCAWKTSPCCQVV